MKWWLNEKQFQVMLDISGRIKAVVSRPRPVGSRHMRDMTADAAADARGVKTSARGRHDGRGGKIRRRPRHIRRPEGHLWTHGGDGRWPHLTPTHINYAPIIHAIIGRLYPSAAAFSSCFFVFCCCFCSYIRQPPTGDGHLQTNLENNPHIQHSRW